MRMNISAWAIRNPVPSLVLFMVLMTLGITTFRSMPVKRFPNIGKLRQHLEEFRWETVV